MLPKSTTYAYSHPDAIKASMQILDTGNVIVVPTETVYGVACRINDKKALSKIHDLKGRDANKPISIMIHDVSALDDLSLVFNQKMIPFLEQIWPGAVTLVFDKAEGGTLGVRIPNNGFMLDLLEQYGPLYVTSANLSDEKDSTTFLMAGRCFADKVPLLIDGGNCEFNQASSVFKVNDASLDVLREGPDCQAMLQFFDTLAL